MRPQLGLLVNGKYRLVRLLGDGGMGSVYEARHEKLGITVALKFLHSELARKPGLTERFLQEARASAQVKSPYVVQVTDVDQTAEGAAFIVLEYLEGTTLQALYEQHHATKTRLTKTEALDFAMQMVEGLEAAHAAGVVHRDLKPDNVMITKNARGEPVLKLLDFGIAKLREAGAAEFEPGLTKPGSIMGTPEYMAPEQAYSADGVDARADVFSLGVIVFEMLAGQRPVGGDDPRTIANAYLSGQTTKLSELAPELAPGLVEAVHRAMSPLAKDRFPTARALREALEPFATPRAPQPPSSGSGRAAASALAQPAGRGTINDSPGGLAPNPGAPAEAGKAGVAKTWPPDDGAESANDAAIARHAAATAQAPRPVTSFDSTTAMDPLAAPRTAPGGGTTAQMAGLEEGAPARLGQEARSANRKRKRGLSLTTILIIAGVLGLAATGVVLVASQQSKSGDEHNKSRPSDPAPATVQPQPPANGAQPAPPSPQPQPPPLPQPPPQTQPPTPAPPPQPQPGGAPRPRPSGAPTAPGGFPSAPGFPPGVPAIPGVPGAPVPSSAPSAPSAPQPQPQIPGLPPLVIPTSIPSFPNPFPPPPPG